MKTRFYHIILLCITAFLLSSCCIQRHVPDGKHFLHENKVVIKGKKVEFKKSDLTPYIIQHTHKVSFPTKFPTWLYYVTENKKDKKFWNWVNDNLTRNPEYYDQDAAYQSARQMKQYLDNRGYFNSKVTQTVKYKNYKAYQTYTIEPSTPYRISKINYQVEDTALMRSVMRLESRFPAKVNDIYNAYTLDEQRIMITDFLRNMGYYYFTREYVTFEVDSSFNDHTLEITMKIDNVKDRETNTYHPQTTEVGVSKGWRDFDDLFGFRPESIIVDLYQDGKKIAEKTVTEEDGWRTSFKNLPVFYFLAVLNSYKSQKSVPRKGGSGHDSGRTHKPRRHQP